MRELSLFTGAGGGVLGTHHLLGWETIGYVEWNEYCQRVIAARIADGYLARAPIFTDVREFVQSSAAREYRGFADVVTAGFPCQPFSVAGKQLAADDERNMWPATRDVIRIVQPQSVLLENVPGLVSCGYVGTVIADLAALGYVGRWGVIGAADAGAPHLRDRLWIVAHAAQRSDEQGQPWAVKREIQGGDGEGNRTKVMANTSPLGRGARRTRRPDPGCAREPEQPFQDVADAARQLPHRSGPVAEQAGRAEHSDGGEAMADAYRPQREGMRGTFGVQPEHADACGSSAWWATDPADEPKSGVGRMAHGVADRVDRLKAIGNGQVSCVAARAWQELSA